MLARRFVKVAALLIVLNLAISRAHAAESLVFEITDVTFQAGSPKVLALQASTNSGTKVPQQLSVRLPGFASSVQLNVLTNTERQLSIPLFDSAKNLRSRVNVTVVQITDFKNLTGVMVPTDEGYFISLRDQASSQPIFWQVSPASATGLGGGQLHISTMILASELPKNMGCGSASSIPELAHRKMSATDDDDQTPQDQTQKNPSSLGDSWRVVQLLAVSPNEFTAGRSDTQIVNQLVSTIAQANVYYEPLRLQVELVGIQLFHPGDADPYTDAYEARDAGMMVQKLRDEWRGRNEPEHDLVAVFGRGTYRYFDPVEGKWINSVGLSFINSSCISPSYSVLFATQGGLTLAAEANLADTLAHEIGHFIGMEHDREVYSGALSLMWPNFVANPSGFSKKSIDEYLSHSGPGKPGGSCFAPTTPDGKQVGEGDALVFEGGKRQSVSLKEGQTLSRVFKLAGTPSGVSFSASGLPRGARFDEKTGALTYSPNYTVADRRTKSRQFDILVTASAEGISSSMNYRITVRDVNRAPDFSNSAFAVMRRQRGEFLKLRVTAEDLDRFDTVKLDLVSWKRFHSLGNAELVRVQRNVLELRWAIPDSASGAYTLTFRARDKNRASKRQSVTIEIE